MLRRIIAIAFSLFSIAPPLVAQKTIPYSFKYKTDSPTVDSLKFLTEVSVPSSNFVRLYLEKTKLGPNSYLLIEGTDGAKQKLTRQDLENWRYSSAYFNGNSVKVYLASGGDDQNEISITSVKTDDSTSKKNLSTPAAESQSNDLWFETPIDFDAQPYVVAIGRFTNGSKSYGTGWIAPNGAIVTSSRAVDNTYYGYDIIEFNVPPSTDVNQVNHPSPEWQFPINMDKNNEIAASFNRYGFKKKYGPAEDYEEGYGELHCSWAILEALPNSTGLKPGEYIQEYLQISHNLGSFTLNAKKDNPVEVDIIHYGEIPSDVIDVSRFRTLKQFTTHLLPSEKYLRWAENDKDDIVLYNEDPFDPTMSDSDFGAPILYKGTKVAMGIHNDFYVTVPSGGCGFRDDVILETLNYYFSNNVQYVDVSSPHNSPSGSIRAPHHTVNSAVTHAQNGAVISIARGYYQLPVTINKSVTLVAPVGTVIIGQAGNNNVRMATLPTGVFDEGDDYTIDLGDDDEDELSELGLTPFPNPFVAGVDIDYRLPRSKAVSIIVYDHLGNKIKSIIEEDKQSGRHTVKWDGTDENGREVTPGVYVIRMEAGKDSKSYKLLKK